MMKLSLPRNTDVWICGLKCSDTYGGTLSMSSYRFRLLDNGEVIATRSVHTRTSRQDAGYTKRYDAPQAYGNLRSFLQYINVSVSLLLEMLKENAPTIIPPLSDAARQRQLNDPSWIW